MTTTEQTTEVSVLENITITDLIKVDEKGNKGLGTLLAKLTAKAQDATKGLKIETKKDRELIASVAHKVSKSKVVLKEIFEKHEAELKKQLEPVVADRKTMIEYMDDLRDTIRKPVTDWEEKEKNRLDNLRKMIAEIRSSSFVPHTFTSADIQTRIASIKNPAERTDFQELQAEYDAAEKQTLDSLQEQLTAKQHAEANAAELERLRSQSASSSSQMTSAPKTGGAVTEVLAAPVEAAGLGHNSGMVGSVTSGSAATEQKRTINRAVMDSIIKLAIGISEEQAKGILTAIVKGQIPNVTINY